MLQKTYDYMVVGAGFVGCVIAEQLASRADKTVLLIDRRCHLGGNAYDFRNEFGILTHRYGPHIFHTNSKLIHSYLSRFTEWIPYEHRVLGLINNRLVPIPFNLTSIQILFGGARADRIATLLVEKYGLNKQVPILKMLQDSDGDLRRLADFVYENVFLNYTKKQWDLAPEQLSPSVMARVPVQISHDDRYFTDSIQCMPRNGYTQMFKRITSHPKITCELGVDYKDVIHKFSSNIVYTGAIDEFFGYSLGFLPYRSLDFTFETYNQEKHQPVGQINYPGATPYTRISEMAHITQEWGRHTTVAIEHPMRHEPGKTIPYYPIPREENNTLHARYLSLAAQEMPNVTFAGRLADYRYYNMDQAVARALSVFQNIIA